MPETAGLNLIAELRDRAPAIILISGGVDSSVVAAAAFKANLRCRYVFFDTPFLTARDRAAVASIASSVGFDFEHIIVDQTYFDLVSDNPRQRCYLCKNWFLDKVGADIITVADGTNADDMFLDRPGLRAGREHGLASPLATLNIGKLLVRAIAKAWNLPGWDTPSRACLASRLPHESRIDIDTLRKIELAEDLLLDFFSDCRVRLNTELVRIECPGAEQNQALRNFGRVVNAIRSAGINGHISLDLTPSRFSGTGGIHDKEGA